MYAYNPKRSELLKGKISSALLVSRGGYRAWTRTWEGPVRPDRMAAHADLLDRVQLPPNSLDCRIVDAVGEEHCVTFSKLAPGVAEAYRKHARYWIRTGRKHGPNAPRGVAPFEIRIVPYHDSTSSDIVPVWEK